MRKLRHHIILPILAAVLLAAAVLFFLWWQLLTSSQELRRRLQQAIPLLPGEPRVLSEEPVPESGDATLLRLRQGDLFALQGQWASAEEAYKAAVDAGGGVVALRKLAQAQLQRRKMDAVRLTIDQLRREAVRSEDLLLLETIVHLRTGELEQARDRLEKAADSPQKHYGKALLAVITGDHEGAKAALAQTLQGWDPALRTAARILQAAYDEYAQFPGSPRIHLQTLLAGALAQNQECELALPLLSQATAEGYRDAWIVQGVCELYTERTDQATISLERAYALDPEKPEIQYFLGRAHAAKEEFEQAIQFFQYALKNGFSPHTEARMWLAVVAEKRGDTGLALSQYKILLEEDKAEIGAFQSTIDLALHIGDRDAAWSAAQNALKKWPESGHAHELVGLVALAMNNTEEARKALERALQLDPSRESAAQKLREIASMEILPE